MSSYLWDCDGVIRAICFENGRTVSGNYSSSLLTKPCPSLAEKIQDVLQKGILLSQQCSRTYNDDDDPEQ